MRPEGLRLATVGPESAELVATTIAGAFEHLRVSEWLVPEATRRFQTVRAHLLLWIEHALNGHGTVYLTDDQQAAAVWFHDGVGVPQPPDYMERLARGCGPYADNFRRLDQAMGRCHPHDQSHHYLAFIAVHPDLQGSGVGSALLRHHTLAHPSAPQYLEASDRRSRKLYLAHGFTDHGRHIVLPAGPTMWPMWREPSGPDPTTA